MKKITKLFTLALSSVLALSLFAGCGDGNNGDKGGNEGEGGNGDVTPSLPEPDKTVSAFSDKDVTLSLDGTVSKNQTISDSLFGVFLEDINYAGYLLDDNLIPNGSFESFSDKKANWTANGATLDIESTNGVLKDAEHYGTQGVNANYAKLSATAGGGLASKGLTHLPLAVEKDTDYNFSAFVRSSQDAVMTVSVKDGKGTYLEKAVSVKGGDKWIKYEETIKSSATVNSGLIFSLSFDKAGTYYLDGIQLETTNATGGIKQYVFDAIKELGPKFIRFPGGCIIEGDGSLGSNTTEVYDWKNSVGAVQTGTNAGDDDIPAFTYTLVKNGQESTATTQGEWIARRQNGDLWGYDMEYGVGFYEYFTLCENLGASAVPVLNCGMSDQGGAVPETGKGRELDGRHGKKVEDYIQDVIDLIEFAKGDTTTKWGALRAALGHEEPFEMDYVGIGNEQFGDYYTEYYEKFLQSDAFKTALAKYSVKTIVGNGMFITNCQNEDKLAGTTTKGTAQMAAEAALDAGVIDKISDYGVHDQHYYVNWTTLLKNYEMYDSYAYPGDDEYYGVFVGEYSANTTASGYEQYQNELIAALAEAAMMTAYEKHGNIIELAAYAPMFGAANTSTNAQYGGNDSVNQWDVDMMYYTNDTIVRTANYYVQQIFMHNFGTSILYKSKLSWTSAETFDFLSSTGKGQTFNKLYLVTSKDANGDLLVKVVNISGEPVKMNVEISNANGRGFAYVTELTASDYKAVNTLKNEAVKPVSSSVGWSGQNFGYELKPYSLTVLRIPTSA